MPLLPLDLNDDRTLTVQLDRPASLRGSGGGRLIYIDAGSVVLEADETTWRLPAGRAAWVPAGVSGLLLPRRQVTLTVIALSASPLRRPGPIVVSSLLMALIERLSIESTSADGPLRAALAEELTRIPGAPDLAPAVTDARLRRLAAKLLEPDGLRMTLAVAGREVGMSARNLSRLVRRETHLSFVGWRQKLHVAAALTQLAQGESVATVAYAIGYDSPSAFISMFKRVTGMTPSEYASLIRESQLGPVPVSPPASQ